MFAPHEIIVGRLAVTWAAAALIQKVTVRGAVPVTPFCPGSVTRSSTPSKASAPFHRPVVHPGGAAKFNKVPSGRPPASCAIVPEVSSNGSQMESLAAYTTTVTVAVALSAPSPIGSSKASVPKKPALGV